MESPNTPNPGDASSASAVQSGHWLPALRPNHEDDLTESVPPTEPVYTNQTSQRVSPEPSIANVPVTDAFDIREDRHDAEPSLTDINRSHPPEMERDPMPSAWAGQVEEEETMSEDDDERLDPSWGFKRMSTAQILASGDRSTDFPSFESPAREDTAFFNQAQDNSVVDPPMLGDDETLAPSNTISTDAPVHESIPDTSLTIEETAPELESQERESSPVMASGPSLEEAAEARFEEGLTLIPHTSEDAPPANKPTPPAGQNQLASWTDSAEDTSFFNSIKSSAPSATDPPELTRKSTSTVVEGLHVQLNHKSGEASPTPDLSQDEHTEMPTTTDSPIADTVEDTPPADVEDMWKALVEDDDEFLVEDADDLLPDSEPGSPSSFIASLQDAGVEDNLQPAIQNSVQQTPPSATRPGFGRVPSNPYAPHQPSTSELSQLSPTTTGNFGISRPGLGPMNSFQAHLQRPNVARAESFADQAKGGYKSPYDLPMELSKPKKRPNLPQLPPSTKAVPPPPRTSSMSDKQLQSPFSPYGPGFPPAAAPSSQQAPPVPQKRNSTASIPGSSSVKQKSKSSSFFEELPMASKPRGGSGHGRYTPQQSQSSLPPQILPQSPPTARVPHAQPSPPRQPDPYSQFQLRPPERVDPFTNMPIQAEGLQAAPPPSNRYSPAPPATLTGPRPGPSPRYSPAPPPQQSGAPAVNRYASQPVNALPSQAPPQQAPPPLNRAISQPPPAPTAISQHPFQPRTSSPLAYNKNSIDASIPEGAGLAMPIRPGPPPSHYSGTRMISPPSSIGGPGSGQPANFYASPPKAIAPDGTISGPRRSQTQSPSKQRPIPPVPMPNPEAFARPASAHGQMSPVRSYAQMESRPPPIPSMQARGFQQELEFVPPTDETQSDPLQRWKGSPVFHFGFGGTVVSSFPKHIPRYSAGAVRPQMKAAMGDVSLRAAKDVMQLPEHLATFPGPLRTKSKRKDLLTWLGSFVTKLEADAFAGMQSQASPDTRKRDQEKVLLWKITKSLVEHDGVLDGNADSLKAINQILTPEMYHLDEATATQYRDDMAGQSAIYRPRGASMKIESVDPMAMETIRKHLLRGARQDAIWYAVDKRLWSHAIIIASTLSRDIWRQVIQEFVKHEVKPAGENTESLSALYEIFGGNLDESIDQLVPPSARAGLQMVSKMEHGGPTRNALEGLDKWKETLSLVINNRSPGDHGALLALGRLLQDYGRIEAAHICYLLGRTSSTPTLFGGADDPSTTIVLLGGDHKKQPFDFGRDHEAILLTEVYEFASLVLPGAVTNFMPHLSAFKLRRASLLADSGFKSQAQSYCDALMATMKSTKAPAYYNAAFLGELEDFSNRLKQAPVQASGSWMAKPSIEKVSGSLLSKLTNFVAGDDSDADSKGSGRDVSEAGPFAKVAGTPSLSRTGSQSDIYGSYPTPASAPISLPTTFAGSRYAPNGLTSARSSSELGRGRPSLDSQRSPPTSSYGQPSRPSPHDPVNMMQHSHMSPPSNPYQPTSFGASPPSSNYHATPPQSSYMPNAMSGSSPARNVMQPRKDSYIPTPPPEQSHAMPYDPQAADLSALQRPASESPAFGGFVQPTQPPFNELAPPMESSQELAHETPAQSYGYGYEPLDTGYSPYVPEPDSPEVPKAKKSFMNDVNGSPPTRDHLASASAPVLSSEGQSQRAANDAAADAAFRAAAEADAALAAEREKEKQGKGKGSGWFGGWLGGAKKPDSLDTSPAPSSKGAESKVYRAKLGESKMKLYYDEKLKKWVNPDNPDAATKSTSTPPPPRMGGTPAPPMGPPRSVSNLGAPPSNSPLVGGLTPPMGPLGSGPPSRVPTPASGGLPLSATLGPSVNASLSEGGGIAGLGVSGPPSRPSTAMSNASSIDDLLGPGGGSGMGRKSVKGKKGGKGRYVDVMAK